MTEPVLIGWDTATRRTGWCAGSGGAIPQTGAILLQQYENDLGGMLDAFDREVIAVANRFQPTHFIYESPILKPTDHLLTVRKLYALGGVLELRARRLGILICEEPAKALKKELTGKRHAEKGDMVFVARKVGVRLPETKAAGMEDAADAFAAWLIGVRHYAKAHSGAWDRRLYSSRGAMF